MKLKIENLLLIISYEILLNYILMILKKIKMIIFKLVLIQMEKKLDIL